MASEMPEHSLTSHAPPCAVFLPKSPCAMMDWHTHVGSTSPDTQTDGTDFITLTANMEGKNLMPGYLTTISGLAKTKTQTSVYIP